MRASKCMGLIVAVLLAAGCSSSDDSGGSSGDPSGTTKPGARGEPGPTTGLTATTMRVAFMVPDFGALEGSGLVPDLGDVEKQVQAYVDHVNDGGGIAGRQIEASYHTFDPADFSGKTSQAACIEATEEGKVFAVVGMPSWQPLGTLCVGAEHRTPIISQTEVTPEILKRTGGRAFSIGMDFTRQYEGWVSILDELGELDGKTVGIITGEDNTSGVEAVEQGLEPALAKAGHEVAEKVVLPCAGLTCEQHEGAVERFRRAGVDYVFDALTAVASPTFIQAADAAGYHPEFTFANTLIVDTVANFHKNVASVIDGMLGVGSYSPPNPGQPVEEDTFTTECNEIFAESVNVDRHPPGSDAAGMTNAGCVMIEILKRGAEAVDELGQDSLVAGIEGIGELRLAPPVTDTPCTPVDRVGSLGPDKHDLENWLNVLEFDGATSQFLRPEQCRFFEIAN